jgi:predicted dehydrogenase
MTASVRVGVIGTSRHTEENHLRSLKSHPRAEIAAICGRNQERAREVAQRNGIPGVYADYRAMIAAGGLDALVISTPEDTHYSMAMAALEAGLHVLCEKPLAMTSAQARVMFEKAEAAGVVHATYFNWRWVPHFREMRALQEQGFIGRPFSLSMRWWLDIGKQAAYLWRLDRNRANGVLADLGSHMIDLARLHLGEVSRVTAQLGLYRPWLGPDNDFPDPANDTPNLLLDFAGGGQGALQLSFVTFHGKDTFEMEILLHGTEGTLRAAVNMEEITLEGARRGEDRLTRLPVDERFWEASEPQGNPFERYLGIQNRGPVGIRQFVDAILGEGRPDATFYDGWKAQQVIDAALESARRRAWVAVE